MMRALILLILVFLVACRQDDNNRVTPPPANPPPTEPQVDTTFVDQQAIETWRAGIAAQIQTDAAVPHPREIWRYAADFRVNRSRPDPLLGDPAIWDAITVASEPVDYNLSPTPLPTADQALALEAKGDHWDAAEIWIVLARLDDARRCGKELERKGEWKVVAMTAVHTGDLDALDRATKHMVDADQITKTRDVVTYAFSHGKVDIARRIATNHGWKLSDILSPFQARELALKGHGSILLELLDREISAWEKGKLWELPEYPGPQIIVADIALLAKVDPTEAKAYARRYLDLPSANVLIWTECGEGCYSNPVAGVLELYQLVRADQSLRELYLARLRTAIDEMFPVTAGTEQTDPKATVAGIQPGNYSGWSVDMWGNGTDGILLTSYLQRVRAMNDSELTRFWVAMLDTFPSRSGMHGPLNFERELGLCALGLPFYQSVGNITPVQKFLLEELKGGANTQMEDTWAAWEKELPSDDRRQEIEHLFHVLTRGEISPSREAQVRAELKIQQTPGEETSLRGELRERFRLSLSAHYGNDWGLRREFEKVQKAYKTNAAAKAERVRLGLPMMDLYPDTPEELAELMEPSMEGLCLSLPAQCTHWREIYPWPESTAASAEPSSGALSVADPTPPTAVTNCFFVRADRPQVGEKHIVRCEGSTYLAIGTYEVDHYVWSDLTPYTY